VASFSPLALAVRKAFSAPYSGLFLRNNLIWCKLSRIPNYFLIGFQWAE